VYGLDYVMAPRDYRALEGLELVPFDVEFDLARAVKSEAELESVRDSVRINERGFEVFFESYAPGKSAAEVMAAAEEWFVAEGCGRLTMNMVLTGDDPDTGSFARPEFKIARREETLGRFLLPSLEIAGPGMHWVEISRAVAASGTSLSPDTERMTEAYVEYFDAARSAMRPGASCHDLHRAVSRGFTDRGYHLGHVTGHSIGMTMIEFPKVGEGVETELHEGMVFSMHPHAIAANGEDCLYMQETWLVTADGGEPLSGLPMQVFVT
jgi:Xaa-Pro aminopeptidase